MQNPVKRKRDLFPGSRQTSQRSLWRYRQLNVTFKTGTPLKAPPPLPPKDIAALRKEKKGDNEENASSNARSTLLVPEY